jgi:hypothetical protein
MDNRQYISIRFIHGHGQGKKTQSKTKVHDHSNYIGKFQIKTQELYFQLCN